MCVCVCSVTQLHLILCDSMDCSLSGSSVHGISEAKILPFSPPGDRPNPGIKPVSLVSHSLAGGFFITVPPGTLVDTVEVMLGTKQEKNCSRFHQQ